MRDAHIPASHAIMRFALRSTQSQKVKEMSDDPAAVDKVCVCVCVCVRAACMCEPRRIEHDVWYRWRNINI